MEKRINFSMEDLTARAHAYDYFRTFFRGENRSSWNSDEKIANRDTN
jgi:hypothetical protein